MCTNLNTQELSSILLTIKSHLKEEKEKTFMNYEKAKTIFSIENELNTYKKVLR